MSLIRDQIHSDTRHFPSNWEIARLIRILQAHLPALAEQYGVRWLGVFGSYVRNEQRPDSDLDLLVEFDDRGLTLLQVIGLQDYLSDLLGVNVDLVERDCLKPTIGRYILQEVVAV